MNQKRDAFLLLKIQREGPKSGPSPFSPLIKARVKMLFNCFAIGYGLRSPWGGRLMNDYKFRKQSLVPYIRGGKGQRKARILRQRVPHGRYAHRLGLGNKGRDGRQADLR
jgi:hypothetical protein